MNGKLTLLIGLVSIGLLLIGFKTAQASVDDQAYKNAKALCNLFSQANSAPKAELKIGFFDQVSLILDRSRFVGLSELAEFGLRSLEDPQKNRIIEPRSYSIFYVAEKALHADEIEEQEFDLLAKQVIFNSHNWLSPLKKSSTEQACFEKAVHIGFTDFHYQKMNESIQRLSELKGKVLAKRLNDLLEKTLFSLQQKGLGADLTSTRLVSDSQEILLDLPQYLRSEIKNDLYFFFHGSKEGFLFDIANSPITFDFFDSLSNQNQISSIYIFTCFAEAVRIRYQSSLQKLRSKGVKVFFAEYRGALRSLSQLDLSFLPGFLEKSFQLKSPFILRESSQDVSTF